MTRVTPMPITTHSKYDGIGDVGSSGGEEGGEDAGNGSVEGAASVVKTLVTHSL